MAAGVTAGVAAEVVAEGVAKGVSQDLHAIEQDVCTGGRGRRERYLICTGDVVVSGSQKGGAGPWVGVYVGECVSGLMVVGRWMGSQGVCVTPAGCANFSQSTK